MINWILGENTKEPSPKRPPVNILVFDRDKTDWASLFSSCENVRVYQCGFNEVTVSVYTKPTPKVMATVERRDGPRRKDFFQVHLALIREEPRGAIPSSDWRNIVYGLQYGGVPSVNAMPAVLGFLERTCVFGELLKIKGLPLIEQSYHSCAAEMLITPPVPICAKLGHAHAGAGKMLLQSSDALQDFRSVALMTDFYVTTEPFVSQTHEVRIQRIGSHTRAYAKVGVGGSWKTNTGPCLITPIAESEERFLRYREWADRVSQLFGGLDIFAIDVIVEEQTGKEFILEVNPSSIGLAPDFKHEDEVRIAQLCISKFGLPLLPKE